MGLMERARAEVDLRKMMHGDDRSNWSRADRMMEELLTALEATREDDRKWRFAANGPQGTFYTDDIGLAASILRAYDKNYDWTVTDVVCPRVTLGAGTMKAIDQARGEAE